MFAEGLQHAYSAAVPFRRDGLYLLHKEGHYSLTSTPLAVLWKDSTCSQYFIDTDANGVVPEQQVHHGLLADMTMHSLADLAALLLGIRCRTEQSQACFIHPPFTLPSVAEYHSRVSYGSKCGDS